ncbi:interferon-inducible GTPase 5-like [Stegostoma tigrinum]|uniref:interferon-inducible GTPase 5-like n=1 Tax=Stegostoma tigrinum TaxID=3053191 RepID=UPI00202AF837|nr:interferon-inducible GTPase 5-like [Stegostoma tigrinum]XP_048379649.1 interferon-inducible GTPase 5-like [Stegostoma tigrinum]XP_048379650.1 interferon-inducible GTPase 5-like [Stegostoma tigrinum]XP_048379651.1 interferon-inducible GTPase 5-like [Stegostoma tigrinum]
MGFLTSVSFLKNFALSFSQMMSMDLEVEGILERLLDAVNRGGTTAMAALVQAERRRIEQVTVDVAVTGPSRCGKSTFIHSAMGFQDGDEGGPSTAPGPGATKPAPYRRPGFPCCAFWELPSVGGGGGGAFSPRGYLRAVEADRYAGFYLLSPGRFTQQAAALADELRRLGKPFYFVRTKIDADAGGREDRGFARASLQAVAAGRFARLDLEYAVARFFCVSCHESERFDFAACIRALQRSAPPLQRHALLLCLHHLADKMELKNSLKELIPVAAVHSCVVDPVEVEQLPYRANVAFLCDEIRLYRLLLGLDYPALSRTARLVGRPAFVLCDEIQTRLARELTEKAVADELLRWTEKNVLVSPGNAKWIPLLGRLPGGELSGTSTIRLLDAMLEQFMDDVYRIRRKMADVLRGD